MPVVVNPYVSFGGTPPNDITEPWGEVARQETLGSGKLTVSGLNLSGMMAVQLIISGVTVTTDDSTVSLRYLVGGSEVATGYRWAADRIAGASEALGGSDAATEILLTSATATNMVGNGSTKALGGVITVCNPGSTTLHKRCYYRTDWLRPGGGIAELANGGATMENVGAITGFVLFGSSDLTGGSMIVLGVE